MKLARSWHHGGKKLHAVWLPNENELARSLPISILEKMNNDYFMSVPGDPRLGFIVNLPPALSGEGVNTLPPYAPVRASKVDLFPGAPAEWPRSSGNTASYFIPIVEGRGMWLDFNRCFEHPHHVSVVVSIQGVNPLTGRKADKLELERYGTDDKVEEWLRGRQNYLATTSTPRGTLWIDGFRAADGTVRQYIFTKDEKKGVASQIIGVDRVFAIGVAFFLSKEPKPVEQPRGGRRNYGGGSSDDFLIATKGTTFWVLLALWTTIALAYPLRTMQLLQLETRQRAQLVRVGCWARVGTQREARRSVTRLALGCCAA